MLKLRSKLKTLKNKQPKLARSLNNSNHLKISLLKRSRRIRDSGIYFDIIPIFFLDIFTTEIFGTVSYLLFYSQIISVGKAVASNFSKSKPQYALIEDRIKYQSCLKASQCTRILYRNYIMNYAYSLKVRIFNLVRS